MERKMPELSINIGPPLFIIMFMWLIHCVRRLLKNLPWLICFLADSHIHPVASVLDCCTYIHTQHRLDQQTALRHWSEQHKNRHQISRSRSLLHQTDPRSRLHKDASETVQHMVGHETRPILGFSIIKVDFLSSFCCKIVLWQTFLITPILSVLPSEWPSVRVCSQITVMSLHVFIILSPGWKSLCQHFVPSICPLILSFSHFPSSTFISLLILLFLIIFLNWHGSLFHHLLLCSSVFSFHFLYSV